MGTEKDDAPPRTVRYERVGHVALVVLDRPPVNAYDGLLHHQFQEAWRRAARDAQVRVVVLAAEGKHFCAGANLKDPTPAPDAADSMSPWDELAFIRDLPKPTLVAVQGGCIGGGQRFVFPCDLIICSEDAFFADPLAKVGGIGGIQAPVHVWMYGPRLAKEMLFSGRKIPAARLYEMGLVNRLVPRERLRAEAMELAQEISEINPAALKQAKRAVNVTMDIMGQHHVVSRFADLLDVPPDLSIGSS